VLVEVREDSKCRVAQEAFVCHPIPRALRRPHRRRGRRLVPTRGGSEKSGGIRDIVIRVSADDETIELFACHARRASSRFEVECEVGGGDEGFITAAAGTAHVGGLVDSGIHMIAEVVLVLEMLIAVPAIMMIGTLSVMFLTGVGASKVAIAIIAWPMCVGIFCVLLQCTDT
jgi:hypothetical protein